VHAKQWGPFTGRQLTTIIVAVILAVAVPVGASAAVNGNPVFLTDATSGKHAGIDPNGNLKVQAATPSTQFSIPPTPLWVGTAGPYELKPDPSGTRYVISSFTVDNQSNQVTTARLGAFGVDTATSGCRFTTGGWDAKYGPSLTVQPGTTGTLTFPQPFVIAAVKYPKVCLEVTGEGVPATTWTAVGYKVLPRT
jgi:hypothetical protein